MKLHPGRLIAWYSATLGVAAGAVFYAFSGLGPVLPGSLVFAAICYGSVAAVVKTEENVNPYRKLSESIAVAGILVFLPMLLFVDILTALIVFLAFALLSLNFQTYDYRRFYVGLAVGFIGICVGAAQAKNGFYLFFFLIYTVVGGMTLGEAYMTRRRQAGAMQWDWIDRTRVCLVMIALALTIYLLLPRLPAGGFLAQPGSDHFYRNLQWEAEAEQNENQDAFSQLKAFKQAQQERQEEGREQDFPEKAPGPSTRKETFDQQGVFGYKGFEKEFNINTPDDQTRRFSNRIVARMRADRPQYLRVRIFDLFDGLHWRASSDQMIKRMVGFKGITLIPPQQYTSSDLEHYEIFIAHDLGPFIPAAAVPVALQFPANAIGVDLFGQLRSPGALKQGTAYAVTSEYNVLRGRLFAELDLPPLPSYRQLPEHMDPRITELAARVTSDAPTQLAAALALEQHLRTRYHYDFSSIFTSQNTTPLSDFLFETRSGHCEYFASALAVMLRTRDIASRLVTGFSATNRNPLTGYFDIYALDGHAWVEAHVDGLGWIILEPTAYYDGPLPGEEKLSARQINEYVERQVKQRRVLGRNELSLTAIIHSAWQLFYVLISAGLAYVKWFMLANWPWLLPAAIVVFGACFAWRKYRESWLAYRLARSVAAFKDEQPDAAVSFYLTAIKQLLHLAGFQHYPGMTIEGYLRVIAQTGAVPRDDRLAAAFNRIFYNGETGDQTVPRDYKQVFTDLYALGLSGLKTARRHSHAETRAGQRID